MSDLSMTLDFVVGMLSSIEESMYPNKKFRYDTDKLNSPTS